MGVMPGTRIRTHAHNDNASYDDCSNAPLHNTLRPIYVSRACSDRLALSLAIDGLGQRPFEKRSLCQISKPMKTTGLHALN